MQFDRFKIRSAKRVLDGVNNVIVEIVYLANESREEP